MQPALPTESDDETLVQRQLAVLGRLAEAGLEIAIALEAQAKGGAVVVQGDVAMAYNHVARAVRHTLMLQSKLIEARRDARDARAGRNAAARAGASRLLRGLIEDGPDPTERLTTEAAERLRQEDFTDLLSRPFGEAVAILCKDLGLAPDWLALAEDCFAVEAGLAGAARASQPPDNGPLEIQWLPQKPVRHSDSS